MYYSQSFFHRCHSLALEDISLFFLDLLPYSDEDVRKGDFYGAIFSRGHATLHLAVSVGR